MVNPGYTMYSAPVSPSYLAEIRRKFNLPDYHKPTYYDHLSRYENIRTIKNEDNKLIHETYYNYKINERDEEKYYTVTNKSESRLDIISLINYKTPQYWWIIAIANNIIDPLGDIKTGTTLRIPDITAIYETGSMFG